MFLFGGLGSDLGRTFVVGAGVCLTGELVLDLGRTLVENLGLSFEGSDNNNNKHNL